MVRSGRLKLANRQMWAQLGIGLCLVYTVSALGYVTVRGLVARWPPIFALINSAGPLLFAPVLLTLPLATALRSRAGVLGSLALVSIFAVEYGPLFLPQADPALARTDARLTVMTFNLGMDGVHLEQFAAAIEGEGADIVALQEVSPNIAYWLEAELRDHYPYAVLHPDLSATGLLSRLPILESEWFQPAGTGTPAIHAVLQVHDVITHVLVAHPAPPGVAWTSALRLPAGLDVEANQRQIADIARRAAGLEGPVIVLGDLNMTDQTRAYAQLSGIMKDAFREAGWGFGFTFPRGRRIGPFPIPGPLARLDYVFHSDDLYAEWARVNCKTQSDHCYLTAELTRLASGIP